jgi:hypothetical protein
MKAMYVYCIGLNLKISVTSVTNDYHASKPAGHVRTGTKSIRKDCTYRCGVTVDGRYSTR